MQTNRVLGLAALVQVTCFVASAYLYLVALPAAKLELPAGLYDVGTLAKTGTLIAILALDIPFALVVVVVASALCERMLETSRIGAVASLVFAGAGAALLIASAAVGLRGLTFLSGSPSPAAVIGSLPSLIGTVSGLEDAGLFLVGLWVLTIGLIGWGDARFPRWLSALGLIAGLLYGLVLIVPTQPVSPLLETAWIVGVAVNYRRNLQAGNNRLGL